MLWSPSYYPRFGGLENASREYALYFKQKGWDVRIITNKYPISLPAYEEVEGLSVYRYYFLNRPIEYIKSLRLDLFFSWIMDISVSRSLQVSRETFNFGILEYEFKITFSIKLYA